MKTRQLAKWGVVSAVGIGVGLALAGHLWSLARSGG